MYKNILFLMFGLSGVVYIQPAANKTSFPLHDLTVSYSRTDDEQKATYYYHAEVVGYILYGIPDKKKLYTEIYTLSVKKKHRLNGIGSFMLQRCVQDLKSNGCRGVRLEAVPFKADLRDFRNQSERLIRFYQKNGFTLSQMSFTVPIMHKHFCDFEA